MIITENTNIDDSILFYLSAREVLDEMIDISGDINNKENLKKYIWTEVTDFQVLSLLVTGIIPEEKENFLGENILLDHLKNLVINNFENISEIIGSDETKQFITEIDVLPEGNKTLDYLLSEDLGDLATAGGKIIKKVGQSNIGTGINKLKEPLSQIGKGTKEYVIGSGNEVLGKLYTIGHKSGVGGIISKLSGQSWFDKLRGDQVVPNLVGGGVVVLSTLALATLVAYAANKTYQRYFSKAAAACKGKSGGEKTLCIRNTRIKALNIKMNELKKGLSSCPKAKSPKKCGKIIGGKIQKVRSQLEKLQKK